MALLAAVLASLLWACAALKSRVALDAGARLMDWTYYPPDAQIGICTGGLPEHFTKNNFGTQTASIMLKYAEKHNYAFYVDRNISRHADRRMYWNKVILMHKLLREVPMLVWMDPEMIIKELDTPIEDLLKKADCDGTNQKETVKYLSKKAQNDTFMWVNSDLSPHQFPLNVNTGMVILKRVPRSFHFLAKVWNAGNDSNHFKKHNDHFAILKNAAAHVKGVVLARAAEGEGGEELSLHDRISRIDDRVPGYGWPFEQGAFWDILLQEPEEYLRRTCVARMTQLHSVRFYNYGKGTFAHNMHGRPDNLVAHQAHLTLLHSKIKPELH